MDDLGSVLHGALCLGVAGCTISYFFIFLSDPAHLDKFLGNNRRYNMRAHVLHGSKWHTSSGKQNALLMLRTYAWALAAGIGLAFCLYKGAFEVLFWTIPRTWTTDEGEWSGHFIALFVGFMGALAVIMRTEEIASQTGKAEELRQMTKITE